MSLLLVAITAAAFASNTLPVCTENGIRPKLTIHIEFGRKSKGCRGIGICRYSWEFSYEGEKPEGYSTPITGNTATGTAWIENGRLNVEFDRVSMTDATYQAYFSTGDFIIIDDFEVPQESVSLFGLKGYTIKAGQYEVPALRSDTNTFTVIF